MPVAVLFFFVFVCYVVAADLLSCRCKNTRNGLEGPTNTVNKLYVFHLTPRRLDAVL